MYDDFLHLDLPIRMKNIGFAEDAIFVSAGEDAEILKLRVSESVAGKITDMVIYSAHVVYVYLSPSHFKTRTCRFSKSYFGPLPNVEQERANLHFPNFISNLDKNYFDKRCIVLNCCIKFYIK